jgi:hypothetical protein
MNNLTNKTVFACAISALIALAATVTPAFADITISPSPSGDDTERIKQMLTDIRGNPGMVRFEPGEYRLSGPLPLQSRTYQGAGIAGSPYRSVLKQFKANTPIFEIDEPLCFLGDVTIEGLTFDAVAEGVGAIKANCIRETDTVATGITAEGKYTGAVLVFSTLRDNQFLTGLTEGIDTPMQGVRIENNQFGLRADPNDSRRHRRHIHSKSLNGDNTFIWLSGNYFSGANGREALLFDAVGSLQIIGNRFEANQADTTLRIKDSDQVPIRDNYFEGNKGAAQMIFEDTHFEDPYPNGAEWIIRLEHNFYNLHAGNCFVFLTSHDPEIMHPSQICPPKSPVFARWLSSVPQVYMSDEAGVFSGTAAELTGWASFNKCHLHIVGPVHLVGYSGLQATGNPSCPVGWNVD